MTKYTKRVLLLVILLHVVCIYEVRRLLEVIENPIVVYVPIHAPQGKIF